MKFLSIFGRPGEEGKGTGSPSLTLNLKKEKKRKEGKGERKPLHSGGKVFKTLL